MNHCEEKDRQKKTGGQLKPSQEIAVQYKLNPIKRMSGYVHSFQKCISTEKGSGGFHMAFGICQEIPMKALQEAKEIPLL